MLHVGPIRDRCNRLFYIRVTISHQTKMTGPFHKPTLGTDIPVTDVHVNIHLQVPHTSMSIPYVKTIDMNPIITRAS